MQRKVIAAGFCALTAAGLLLMAGCGNKPDAADTGSTAGRPDGTTAAPAAAPVGTGETGARRGNPEPNAAANAAAFKAARDKAAGR